MTKPLNYGEAMSENPKNYIYTENYEMKIKKKRSKMLLFYNHNLQSDTYYTNSDIPHFFIKPKYLIIDKKIV